MERMEEAAAASAPLEFEAFFDTQRRQLLRALYLLTGNMEEAEELMQDAFLAVWERWDRVGAMVDPAGYLYRTALNMQRNRVRRAIRVARKSVGRAHGGDLFASIDERDALARALTELSPRRRAAIVLTELLEHSSEEAGKTMGIKAVTVRRLAQDAREQLKRSLAEGNDG
jgi:RNA polymerase sigma-70 factor (ECF subfamily)